MAPQLGGEGMVERLYQLRGLGIRKILWGPEHFFLLFFSTLVGFTVHAPIPTVRTGFR